MPQVDNYGTVTKPCLEYWFVVDPSDEKLRKLGEPNWPYEKTVVDDQPGNNGPELAEKARIERRKPLPLRHCARIWMFHPTARPLLLLSTSLLPSPHDVAAAVSSRRRCCRLLTTSAAMAEGCRGASLCCHG